MDKEFKRAYADAYPDRLPDYVAGRWSHVCADGNMQWCRHGEHCGICLKREDDGLGHHGPKDRDRTGPGAVPRRPTGDYTVSLRDDVEMRLFEFTLNGPHRRPDFYELADAILALVRGHLGSDEAKVRAMSAAWKAYETEQGRPPEGADAMFMAVCAAITAALGEGE